MFIVGFHGGSWCHDSQCCKDGAMFREDIRWWFGSCLIMWRRFVGGCFRFFTVASSALEGACWRLWVVCSIGKLWWFLIMTYNIGRRETKRRRMRRGRRKGRRGNGGLHHSAHMREWNNEWFAKRDKKWTWNLSLLLSTDLLISSVNKICITDGFFCCKWNMYFKSSSINFNY